MKMTLEEAEEKKAYCGRCTHWRLMKESEIESYHDRKMTMYGEVTRAECAEFEKGKNVCVLGICSVSGARNFNDEMYAGDCGEPEDCHDWELWEG